MIRGKKTRETTSAGSSKCSGTREDSNTKRGNTRLAAAPGTRLHALEPFLSLALPSDALPPLSPFNVFLTLFFFGSRLCSSSRLRPRDFFVAGNRVKLGRRGK
ncbi:hypothetical protein MRX96_056415 [Rhipicephalus microplus]